VDLKVRIDRIQPEYHRLVLRRIEDDPETQHEAE